MKDRLRALDAVDLLNAWFTNTGHPRMTAQMWAALTLPNRKVCLDRALDLLQGEQAVAS